MSSRVVWGIEQSQSVCDSAPRRVLREIASGLELGPPFELVALELPEPEATLNALPTLARVARAELPRAVVKRRAEFAAGRYASALLLSRSRCFEPVGRTASGAPRWPLGFVGSISHGAGVVLVAVVGSRSFVSVGVDVERLIAPDQARDIADRILDGAELEQLALRLHARSPAERVSFGFSAKESVYKCLSPLVARFFDFADVRLSSLEPDSLTSGRMHWALSVSLNDEYRVGFQVQGRYAFIADRVETAVWISTSL